MSKKALCLNIAILILIMLLSFGAIHVSAYSDNGYAVFYQNLEDDSVQVPVVLGVYTSSNINLELYQVLPKSLEDGVVGKRIVAFNSKPDGSGESYPLTSLVERSFTTEEDSPGELYAQWEDAEEYSILYIDTTGGDGSGTDYYLQSGTTETVQLAGEVFSGSDGKRLVGWRDKTHFSLYDLEEEIEISQNMTLLSKYGVNAIVLHYKLRDGSYQSQNLQVEYPGLISDVNVPRIKGYVLTGWNTKEDGTGDWIVNMDSETPHHLYAQYELLPEEEEYYILKCDSGLSDGRLCSINTLVEGKAILPEELFRGQLAAYYYSNSDSSIKYPCSIEVEIENGEEVWPEIVAEGLYYAIFDGCGGKTSSGSDYAAAITGISSSGSLMTYSLGEVGAFSRDDAVLAGFSGKKTGTRYELSTDLWSIVTDEAEGTKAYFDAEYETVSGGYIQYLGNGAVTAEGKDYVIVSELSFNEAEAISLLYGDAAFNPPEGKCFLGWNTKKNGDGEWYNTGETVHFNKNAVLWAQWGHDRITYHTVEYYPWSEEFVEDTSVSIDSGYIPLHSWSENDTRLFKGWNTKEDGTGDWYANDSVEQGTVLELYAQWEQEPEEGYYYVLWGKKQPDGTVLKIVPMSKERETITLPDLDKAFWGNMISFWGPWQNGYYDEYEPDALDLSLPGSEKTVSSGTRFRVVEPHIYINLHENREESNRERIYYCITSNTVLTLYGAKEVFYGIPDEEEFVDWNTEIDGSGHSFTAGDTFYSGSTGMAMSSYIERTAFDLFAQWSKKEETAPVVIPDWIWVIPSIDKSAHKDKTDEDSTELPFTDIASDAYYFDAVRWALDSNITAGTSETTFDPDLPCSRAQAITFIWRAAGSPKPTNSSSDFTDVDKTDYYSDAVSWAVEEGITKGTSLTEFSPNEMCNRSQFVTFLWRADGSPSSISEVLFDDVQQEQYYSDAVAWAVDKAITTGITETRFGPFETCTRAQVVSFLYRSQISPVIIDAK